MSTLQQQQQQQAPDLLSGPAPNQYQEESAAMTNYVSMEMGGVPPVINANNDEDNHSISPSMVESVMTADGLHDETGFLVVCMVILIGDMSRGIFFPTLWPLVSSLGGSTITLGYSVAAFSGGRIIMSPLFGSLSVSMGYTKTLLCSVSILLIGTLVYAQVQNVGSAQFLIVAQVLLGVGSGTLGVTRAFVADITAKRNRTTYMAWITAVQYSGFTVTPFVGAFLTKIFGDNEYIWGYVHVEYSTVLIVLMYIVLYCRLLTSSFHLSHTHTQPIPTQHVHGTRLRHDLYLCWDSLLHLYVLSRSPTCPHRQGQETICQTRTH
jgi:ceroid-lipofuscinosis MFS transporter 7